MMMQRQPEKGHPRCFCVMPWCNFCIETYEGDVYPCCRDWSRQSYGNIRRQSLETIWNSETAQAHRQAMLSGDFDDFCRPTCPKRWDGSAGPELLERIMGPGPIGENAAAIHHALSAGLCEIKTTPLLLQALLTSRCNLRCIMCDMDHDKTNLLPADALRQMEAVLPSAFRLTLLGGEVLCDPVARAYTLSMTRHRLGATRLGLVTNGTMLDRTLLGHMHEYDFDFVIVSINAASEETYRQIHGVNAYPLVLDNILRLKSESPDTPLFASFVIQPENYFEVPAFVDLFREKGIPIKLVPVCLLCGRGGREGTNNAMVASLDAAILQCRESDTYTLAQLHYVRDVFLQKGYFAS